MARRETLEIGATPSEEPCLQLGSPDYTAEAARAECRRFIAAIIRLRGDPPAGCYLAVKAFSHDFGSYHEVVAKFDADDEEQNDWAYGLEESLPGTWAEYPGEGVAAGTGSNSLVEV